MAEVDRKMKSQTRLKVIHHCGLEQGPCKFKNTCTTANTWEQETDSEQKHTDTGSKVNGGILNQIINKLCSFLLAF